MAGQPEISQLHSNSLVSFPDHHIFRFDVAVRNISLRQVVHGQEQLMENLGDGLLR